MSGKVMLNLGKGAVGGKLR